MSVDSSWLGQIEREWAQLRQCDPSLDVERFFRHVVSEKRSDFSHLNLSPPLRMACSRARCRARLFSAGDLLERVGPDRHPSLLVALAPSLVTETGGPAGYEGGHVILGDVLKDDTASEPLRGMAAAALADSARLGRGMDADLEMAKDMYATALERGHRSPRTTLVCTGRDAGTEVLLATSSPTPQRWHRPTSAVVRTQNAPPV
ncbi:hypothetical protein B0G80_2033 [Paraburkholderia sp. BL6669N2]|nr:hypothetical protein B0G80_2033 [Paraburkholderia sp. BL6669N2]